MMIFTNFLRFHKIREVSRRTHGYCPGYCDHRESICSLYAVTIEVQSLYFLCCYYSPHNSDIIRYALSRYASRNPLHESL